MTWNWCIKQALKSPKIIWYIFPEYAQAKRVIFNGMTYDGKHYINDFIPREAIASKNSQELKIIFHNGSVIQCVGSNNYDSLRGAGPTIAVFSEAAYHDPRCSAAILPMLAASSDSIAVYISTPQGKNFFYDMWLMAQNNDEWFTWRMGVDETKHVDIKEIEELERSGQMSHELIQQEFYCSFTSSIEGSIWGQQVEKMKSNKQIGHVPYDPDYLVHTSADLGIKDPSVFICFQVIDRVIHIIDCLEATDEGLSYYVRWLKDKPWAYGQHFFPPDVFVRDLSTGVTRYERLVNLGITPSKAGGNNKIVVADGIDAVSAMLARTWIDENKCGKLIKAMENYHYKYDAKNNVYSKEPVHDMWSHHADALRYLAISIPQITTASSTPEELEKRYMEARYGAQNNHWNRSQH